MTTIRDYSPRAVGIPWVREEDYHTFLAICEDADGFPATWKQFADLSEQAERRYKAQGYIVERAYIGPDTFPDWCRSKDFRINSQARRAFAASIAAEKHGRDHS